MMAGLLRDSIFILLRYSGIPFLLRELMQRRKTTILVYHSLPKARARNHFLTLRARYHIIALADYLRARAADEMWRVPPKSLIITFDDGHRNNFELRQLLEEMRVPITIFLCSGIVGTHRHYWWLHTNDSGERQALKALPDAQRVQTLLRKGHADGREYETRQ